MQTWGDKRTAAKSPALLSQAASFSWRRAHKSWRTYQNTEQYTESLSDLGTFSRMESYALLDDFLGFSRAKRATCLLKAVRIYGEYVVAEQLVGSKLKWSCKQCLSHLRSRALGQHGKGNSAISVQEWYKKSSREEQEWFEECGSQTKKKTLHRSTTHHRQDATLRDRSKYPQW